MKHTHTTMLFAATVLLCLVFSCGKKKHEGGDAVAVVAGDSIRTTDIERTLPDVAGAAVSMKRKVFQAALARMALPPKDTARYQAAVSDMSQLLALRSGTEWTTRQAASAFDAARALNTWLDTSGDATVVAQRLDSLFASIGMVSPAADTGTALDVSFLPEGLLKDPTAAGRRRALVALLSRSLGLAPELADIVADHAYDETGQRDTVSVAEIVKGLVYDPAKAEVKSLEKAQGPALEKREVDNSALALRYRTRQSIMDSIQKHLPHLEAIYKKQLKINQDIAGTIYVQFRVDPRGRVMSARIVRTEIQHNALFTPFLDYVQKIHFCPIPENVGPMTFEFPFEFKAG